MNKKLLTGLCITALVLQLLSVSTNSWSVRSQSTGIDNVDLSLTMGLWKFCADSNTNNAEIIGCKDLPPEGDRTFPRNSLYTVRTFVLLGVLCTFFGLMGKKKKTLLIWGGLLSLIGLAVWARELLSIKVMGSVNMDFNAGYSFYANMIGSVCAIVAGIKMGKQ